MAISTNPKPTIHRNLQHVVLCGPLYWRRNAKNSIQTRIIRSLMSYIHSLSTMDQADFSSDGILLARDAVDEVISPRSLLVLDPSAYWIWDSVTLSRCDVATILSQKNQSG